MKQVVIILCLINSLFSFSQNRDLEFVTTISGRKDILKMSKSEFKKKNIEARTIIKPKRWEVKQYKIKINYDQVFTVEGYRITNEIKEYLDYAKKNSKIVIFEVVVKDKDATYTNIKPITIYTID